MSGWLEALGILLLLIATGGFVGLFLALGALLALKHVAREWLR